VPLFDPLIYSDVGGEVEKLSVNGHVTNENEYILQARGHSNSIDSVGARSAIVSPVLTELHI
jgi:hypothetical protein